MSMVSGVASIDTAGVTDAAAITALTGLTGMALLDANRWQQWGALDAHTSGERSMEGG
jgi:hypothetical protein